MEGWWETRQHTQIEERVYGVGGRIGVGGCWDMDSKNRKKRVYGVGERIEVGGWRDMDSKNRKKRVYGVGGRIEVGGRWTLDSKHMGRAIACGQTGLLHLL